MWTMVNKANNKVHISNVYNEVYLTVCIITCIYTLIYKKQVWLTSFENLPMIK